MYVWPKDQIKSLCIPLIVFSLIGLTSCVKEDAELVVKGGTTEYGISVKFKLTTGNEVYTAGFNQFVNQFYNASVQTISASYDYIQIKADDPNLTDHLSNPSIDIYGLKHIKEDINNINGASVVTVPWTVFESSSFCNTSKAGPCKAEILNNANAIKAKLQATFENFLKSNFSVSATAKNAQNQNIVVDFYPKNVKVDCNLAYGDLSTTYYDYTANLYFGNYACLAEIELGN